MALSFLPFFTHNDNRAMIFQFILLWLCGLLTSVLGNENTGNTNFMDVRSSLPKEYSGRGGIPGDKYFREFFAFSIIVDHPVIDQPIILTVTDSLVALDESKYDTFLLMSLCLY